ncbi:MAG: hypothetical protein NTY64_18690 [Deltaproteobacteria bacterium]|nr:hypothetical protein [Deltaproteobacteria bacterium]
MACVEGERLYAARIKKVVYPALETIQLKHTPQHSFWGVPREEFWSVVNQLQEAAKEDPALGGVMLHSYRGLMEKLPPDVSKTSSAYNGKRGFPVPEGSHFFEPPISY